MAQQYSAGECLRLSLESWGPVGQTLATHDDTEVRVFGGIPGEEVVAQVIKEQRDYVTARVVEVLRPSPHRTTAPCPYFGACTGCQWQHIGYEHQLTIKKQSVVDALERHGAFEAPPVSPTLAAPEQYGYRNHARFTIGRREGVLGFVNYQSRRFVPIPKCLLMCQWINDAMGKLQGRCGETTQISFRYGLNTGDYLIQPALKAQGIPLPSGQTHYQESLGGRRFRIASPSFFQVNTQQAERIVDLVREGLHLSGHELVVDAYAGVGTFAILLAPHTAKMIAIEESTSAVQDAAVNASGIDGIQFLQGKTEEVLSQIEDRPDGVILDPPRAGCHPMALEALVKLAPLRVVYVSCDPETLARDLKILCRGPFSLEIVQPVDMFPQTHHVECVAYLHWSGREPHAVGPAAARKTAERDNIVLASTSPRRRELLSSLGVEFKVAAPSASEEMMAHETPEEMVKRLAISKGKSVAHLFPNSLVIGADSVVIINDRVLGKPRDPSEAREMLWGLRGKDHQVATGVAVLDAAHQKVSVACHFTTVTMRDYSDEEIEAYVASNEPMDKAGAYAVQDKGFHPAARVEGCYTNVMGLPLCMVVDLLMESGFEIKPGTPIKVPDECCMCPLKGTA